MNNHSIPEPTVSPKEHSLWAYEDGQGPTALGNLYSIAKTAVDSLSDLMLWRQKETFLDPLKARSATLTSSIMMQFFEAIKPKADCAFEFSSYLLTAPITALNPGDLEDHLRAIAGKDLQTIQSMSWVIPLIIKNIQVVELSHIVVIVIRANEITYFDSKGILSKNRAWIEDKTLFDAIKICEKVFRDGRNAAIKENSHPHQFDIHNCGLWVSLFAYHAVIDGWDLETFNQKMAAVSDIYPKREWILNLIKGEEANKAPSSELEKS